MAASKNLPSKKSKMTQKNLVCDFSKEHETQQILNYKSLLFPEQKIWNGIYFIYHQMPVRESPEFISKQHLIVIHLDSYKEEIWIDGQFRTEQLTIGESLLIPAQRSHKFYHFDDNLKAILIGIENHFIAHTALESFNQSSVELIPQFSHQNPLILKIGLELKADLAAGYPCGSLYGESLATALAAHLLKQYSVRIPQTSSCTVGLPQYKLRQVLEYINAHLDLQIKLAELAAVVGFSEYHFMRLFKQSMGITVYQYVLQQRVERAKKLLKKREEAIAEIALQCGFANQTHFTKYFRKFTNITPKAFREQ